MSRDINMSLQQTFSPRGQLTEKTVEVVLRGGKPWGFSVIRNVGERFLRINKIETGGKADKAGHLRPGGCILTINDVAVRSEAEAGDVIDAAFRTLAVKVAQSDLDQSHVQSPHTAAFARRVGDLREVDLDRSQDDSLVFIESPSKKSGAKLKNQRRGESFNLKNTGPAWGSSETRESTPTSAKRKWSFKKFGFTKRSASSDQAPQEPISNSDYATRRMPTSPRGGGDLHSQLNRTHSGTTTSSAESSQVVHSSPSLHQYSMNSEQPQQATMVTGASNMAHSQTWQGQDLASKSTSDFGYSSAQSNGELTETTNGYRNNSVGKENRVPPGYKSLLEYKVSQINKSYSTSAIPAASSTKNYRRANNYENVPSHSFSSDQDTDMSSYLSPRSNSVSSPRTPKEPITVPRYSNSDSSNAPLLPPRTYQDEMSQQRDLAQSSEPSLHDGHLLNVKGHSKNPSWPGADMGQVSSINEESMVSASWSDINAASPGPRSGKPVKTFFQPSLNPHLEEKINPKDVKRQLEEHRLRSPKAPPSRQPMVAKADGDTVRAFVFGSDNTERLEISSNKEADTSMQEVPGEHSTAPPLSPSGSSVSKDSSVLNEVSWNVVKTPSAGYMYIVRQKPCYNTSTQTDTPKPEVPDILKSPSDSALLETSSDVKNHAKVLVTEDRAIQARPGSIVAASMPVGMKSVGVGNEQDYDNLEPWEQSSMQSPSRFSNLDSDRNDHQSSRQNDVKPKSPKSSSVSSKDSKPYYLGDEDIAKIQGQSSETAMLRKLSQEYFMQRNPGHRLSANMEDDPPVRKLSLPEDKPPDSPRRLRANDRALESKVSKTTKDALIEMRKDIEYFERQENLGKSQTEAFELVDCNDNHTADSKQNLLSKGSSHKGAFSVSSSGQKSKDSKIDNMDISQKGNNDIPPDSTNMDTHSIAEQARKEWIQTGMFQKYGGPKALKRTVSEQVRPSKEVSKSKHKLFKIKHDTKDATNDKRHKTSDPGNENLTGNTIEHSYQKSDPTANYRGYVTHENRLSSDGNSLFQKRNDRKQRPGSNVSNRSSSSGSTGAEDKNRISDPDLKRLQQKAVLNFFEMKTGKRLSSSSIDSSVGAELAMTPKDKSQDSWHQSSTPSSPFKAPEDKSTPVKKSLAGPNTVKPSRRRASAGANLPAPRHSTKDSGSGPEMSPPPLLDTSSLTTPVGGGMRGVHSYSSSTTSTSLSPSDPHSPPLHPWPAAAEMSRLAFPEAEEAGQHHLTEVEDSSPEINARLSRGQSERQQGSSDDDITELKRRMLQESENKPEILDQTALKAVQYSTSSTEESPSGHSISTDPRFAFHLPGNKLHGELSAHTEEDASPPPALPPRNYRNHFPPESSRGQMPEPMEPPREPRKESHRLSSNMGTDQHHASTRTSSSGSFTDVFTSDYDATPARDMYADQLRQSARRISQSTNPYLNAARYQSKPVAELKPNVATSRPVDKPSMGTTSEPLHANSVISSSSNNRAKDYGGLSSSEGDSPLRSSSSLHSPTTPSPKDRGAGRTNTPPNHGSNDSRYTSVLVESSKRNQNLDSATPHRIHHSPQGSGSSDHGVYLTPVSHSSKAQPSHNSSNSPNTDPAAAGNHIQRSAPTRRDSAAHHSPNPSEKAASSGVKPRHDSASDLDDLPPPPPLPPHHHPAYQHSPSSSKLEDKPLPPLPLHGEGESQDRFSGESYISNKSNYRQAYGGNYRRSAELSPKSPAPYSPRSVENNHSPVATTQPPAGETMVMVTKVMTVNKYSAESSGVTPNTQRNKQDGKQKSPTGNSGASWDRKPSVGEAVPWGGQKTYSPVKPFTSNSRQTDTPSKSETSEDDSTSQQSLDSPSVRSFVANFEQKGKHSSGEKSTPKSKFVNLKDTLDRRSYDREMSGGKASRASNSSLDSPGRVDSRHMSSNEDIAPPQGEAKLYKRNGKGYSHGHTKSDPLRTDRLEFSQMTRTRSVESENLNFTRRTSDISLTNDDRHSTRDSDSEQLNYSCEVRETLHDQSMNSFEISHSRERSDDPQSDGDTRSNDSGVAEDMTHSRQKSQEEIECEKQAALVASQLKDKHLSQVILPPPDHKTTTDYVSGLFDTRVNPNRKSSLRNSAVTRAQLESLKKVPATIEDTPKKSPSSSTPLPANSPYWSPPSLANLQNKMRQEGMKPEDILPSGGGVSLDTEKDELISRIEKKLEILREEKTLLELEIKENDALGKELSELVLQKVQNKAEYNKYQLYVTELDKVMILLLKLSGRLARAENAVSSLSEDATDDQRCTLVSKRDELLEKLDDAKLLKDGIDRRSKQVSVILRKQLTGPEYEDYEYFIKLKSKLTMDQQEINDKLKLGEEQLCALRKSMNQSDC